MSLERQEHVKVMTLLLLVLVAVVVTVDDDEAIEIYPAHGGARHRHDVVRLELLRLVHCDFDREAVLYHLRRATDHFVLTVDDHTEHYNDDLYPQAYATSGSLC